MELFLRRATIEDAEDILRWRNDPATRENSFTKDEIDLETHMAWFKRKLSQEACFMYILMEGDEKAGNIRVDVEDGVGEISYMIAPDKRGRGLGKRIIGLVEEVVREDAKGQDLKALFGVTLKNNAASGRCFAANGYTCEDAGESYRYTKDM